MKIYPYTVSNVSPNTAQSSYNPDSYHIGSDPQCGNSGNYPEITNGWLGTTNDISSHACGEINTDEPGWFSDLMKSLGVPGTPIATEEDILEWRAGDCENDFDIEFDDGDCESDSATWSETDNDRFYPELKPGWAFIYWSDQDIGIEGISEKDLDDLDLDYTKIMEILDSASINYDPFHHQTGDDIDYEYIAVRNDVLESTTKAIQSYIDEQNTLARGDF